jgi:molybdopterin synthase catalytic subunit
MRVRVLAFASASDALGTSEKTLELPPGSTVADLRQALLEAAPSLEALWDRLAVALDDEIVSPDAGLRDGCEVALLPPVSGGSPELPRIRLQEGPVPTAELVDLVSSPERGAVVLFLGKVREQSGGRQVTRLTYSAHQALAEKALERIVADLEEEHPGLSMAVFHRLGEAPVGEATVGIAAASPHREAAFEAGREALERLKKEVPIWKLEEFQDGTSEWREEEPLGG